MDVSTSSVEGTANGMETKGDEGEIGMEISLGGSGFDASVQGLVLVTGTAITVSGQDGTSGTIRCGF